VAFKVGIGKLITLKVYHCSNLTCGHNGFVLEAILFVSKSKVWHPVVKPWL